MPSPTPMSLDTSTLCFKKNTLTLSGVSRELIFNFSRDRDKLCIKAMGIVFVFMNIAPAMVTLRCSFDNPNIFPKHHAEANETKVMMAKDAGMTVSTE
jgi:hypothetical protein